MVMRSALVRFRDSLSPSTRWALLGGFTILGVVMTMLASPLPQPTSYHHFADQRSMFGIPNALNVLSNIPFLIVGFWGIWWMGRPESARHFRDAMERRPARAIFLGL